MGVVQAEALSVFLSLGVLLFAVGAIIGMGFVEVVDWFKRWRIK